MEAWIGVAGTLAGVVLGGLIAYFTTARQIAHEKSLEVNKRQIEKIEKAHELLTSIFVSYRRDLSEDSTLLITGKKSESKDVRRLPFEELEMLFSFYVPALESEAKELVELCHSYGESMIQARVFTPENKEARMALRTELQSKFSAIEAHILGLKGELAKVIGAHVA